MPDYPPQPGSPTPTPTPRPVSPNYVSPADYMLTECNLVKDLDQDAEVKISVVYTEMRRIYQVMRDAET